MSSAPPPPPRSFSKGTMGLKFMQRVVASQPTPSNVPSTSTSTVRQEGVNKEVASEKRAAVEASTSLHEQDGQLWRGATTTLGTTLASGRKKRRLITTSQSLLHFPSIQQAYSSTAVRTNSTSNSASPSTSQAPLMARYSYGGANEEIELLTNPHVSVALTPKVKIEESTKHKTKSSKNSNFEKRSTNHLANSITATTSIRRKDSEAPSRTKSKSKGKESAFEKVEARMMGEADEDEDEGEDEGGINLSGSEFRKPAGMEGVKKRSSAWGGKPSLERKRKKSADPEEEVVVWGKRGDERAWDVGKVQEESDQEEEDSIGSSESCDEE